MFRSFSDVESGRIHLSPQRTQLEANRNQIFARTPAVTKEMLQKLQNAELAPKNSVICGYKIDTKKIIVLLALFFLFILSSGLSTVFWGTHVYDDLVLSKLVIENGTDAYTKFANPQPGYLKIYIFNYTNVREYETGRADKLIVDELGPYTYREHVNRYDLQFSEDGNTILYRENRTFSFVAKLSSGMQNDRVVVPNMAMITAGTSVKNKNFATRFALSTLLTGMNSNPFIKLPADKFILGYDDNLFSMAKNFISGPIPVDVGLLSKRKSPTEVIEMYTGKDDVNKVGIIKSIGGKDHYKSWTSDECNRISGSEGIFFPVSDVRNKRPINILVNDLGRRIPFEFTEEVKILHDTIPSYRYQMPLTVFSHPSQGNFENQCYCSMDGTCPPNGLFNATQVSYGTPLFISQPHFLNADPKLREGVIGMKPEPAKHTSYIDIHPTLGFTTQGWNKLQSNVYIQRAFGLTHFSMFNEDVMLPMNWAEFGIAAEDLSDDLKSILHDISFLLPSVETAFKYGTLLMAAVTFVAMLLVIRTNKKQAPLIERYGESRPMFAS